MKCFHCGEDSVSWNNDFTFEDYNMDGDGIIHELSCSNCGAEITYRVKDTEEKGETDG